VGVWHSKTGERLSWVGVRRSSEGEGIAKWVCGIARW